MFVMLQHAVQLQLFTSFVYYAQKFSSNIQQRLHSLKVAFF